MSTPPTDAPAAAERSNTRFARIVAIVVAFAVVLYFVPGLFVAYTEDAYVRSDFVEVAPEVSGIVRTVTVKDDQYVSVGTPLAVIDAEPFQLDVELKRRQVESALAAATVRKDNAAVLRANLDAAQSALILAQQEFDRISALVKDQTLSQEMMDRTTDQRQSAIDKVEQAKAQIGVNAGEVASAQAQVDIANAQLAIATYNLSRTRITAPVDGYVTNLSLRPGAYASAGVPMLGIVDDTQWRVVANFKEYVASDLKPGMRAWVWLDSHPWRLFPAKVAGVGRGIARQQEAGRLLPYVAPTTDWIRLARRMPVTLVLDPRPEGLPLFMGADARVLLFP
ncbi:MAG: HlyD family secretion protein [Pseudomonadota bacterium]